MSVIDVHTHMLTEDYLAFLGKHGSPKYERKPTRAGQDSIWMHGAPFMTLMPEMWDYDARIRDMDKAGVDLAVVSLTCPNAYFGDESVSVQAARMVNDSMEEQQRARPDRIAWFTSLPWQYADAAIAELERTTAAGAVGVMVIANIDGMNLTHPDFAPVWQAIDDRALPVLVHPTAPLGHRGRLDRVRRPPRRGGGAGRLGDRDRPVGTRRRVVQSTHVERDPVRHARRCAPLT